MCLKVACADLFTTVIVAVAGLRGQANGKNRVTFACASVHKFAFPSPSIGHTQDPGHIPPCMSHPAGQTLPSVGPQPPPGWNFHFCCNPHLSRTAEPPPALSPPPLDQNPHLGHHPPPGPHPNQGYPPPPPLRYDSVGDKMKRDHRVPATGTSCQFFRVDS